MRLQVEPYDGPVGQAMVAAVQQEYVDRYGGPDETPVDPAEFAPPHGWFVVGYLDGRVVATGALRRHDGDSFEIKRMFVVASHRGLGLSRQMLGHLEQLARDAGARRVVLETGSRQPEAIRLYETSGYERIDGFGHYADQPTSFSFAKTLA